MSRLAIFLSVTISLASAQVQDPASESENARQLVVSGQPEQAVAIYKRLASAYPNNPDLLVNFSIAEFQSKQYSEAAEHARAALKLKLDYAAANLFLGASYLKLDQPADALEPLRKAVQAASGDRNAQLMLAEAFLGTAHCSEAVTAFRDLSELLPDNARVWYGLGQTYEALAEQTAHDLSATSPDSSYWLTIEGDSLRKQRRFGSAFAAYRDALSKGPILPGIHAGLARIYIDIGHPEWAMQEEARERLVIAPAKKTGGSAGEYWTYMSYRNEAAQAYEQLDQLPPSLESHLHRAKILDADGRYREASAEWRAALTTDPESRSIRLALAQSLYNGRDYESVRASLKTWVEQHTDSPRAAFLYGASLIHLAQPGDAIRYLKAALRENNQLLDAKAALGQALLLQGRPAEAIPYLTAAPALDRDASTWFQLFRAYHLTGNRALASQAFAAFQRSRSAREEQLRTEDGLHIKAPPS